MELGEKLRQARLEAGLSQRALCGEEITRNMLSQIEHGKARPSMETLKYLAGQLGKPLCFFLDEDVVISQNQEIMAAARRCYDTGDYAAAVEALGDYRGPDDIFDREQALLNVISRLGWAAELMDTGRERYALELLDKTDTAGCYCAEELERRRLSLLSRLRETELPSLDEDLLLRAQLALKSGDISRAKYLLDAAEDQETPRWNLLRGRVSLAEKDYQRAATQLCAAERIYPDETIPCLEECYRELGDYKKAYEYACAGKKRV